MKKYKVDYKSPIGVIEIEGSDSAIYGINFAERDEIIHIPQQDTPKVLMECAKQLQEYFIGERHDFSFPYVVEGTDFQQAVWQALPTVSYGETASYKDIAVAINNEKAVRAVGSANGKNNISIVVPCHRIIGSNGTLTGYGGGMWRKEWLLQHEQTYKNPSE
ncbi:methylated-DNA--[protein]-cysteine S-methyltransferase [Lysinibacillus irui]|uniref:Methylated-DNA--protein-cysteine methyltransferase n=1 Tax=Lysinibacillus irui TaxID=2998077 RepID=A0AAJ5RXL0_9BACI|nr:MULTISPECIES: methylated-DNA--[protein]-cysteine S-methyltransferase [Lysinibacillus]MEA0552177.1 methylated-DNA--[protein]-cysteine S-methyltransferase [Lysinibacillus irui]MEA0978102.1 methylated-DNA--[protein]-cysteine S-methyltransferase [Lysinibacillus irui]MEA1044256.1 methylated-DNA--[protein]-cysteine S-methyltransferase [Lysinibacillus irui]WDV08224.1 methylated-DNA--[protein]-cysteine S-methyltransferase [Lysinibacillus irui]